MPDSSLNRHHLRSAKDVSRYIGPRILPRCVLAQEAGYQSERLLGGRHRPGPSPRRCGDVEGRGHCDQDSGWTAILHSQNTHCCPQRSGVHHSGTPSRRCPLKMSWISRIRMHAVLASQDGCSCPEDRSGASPTRRAAIVPRFIRNPVPCPPVPASPELRRALCGHEDTRPDDHGHLGRMPRSRSRTQIS